MTKGSNYCAFFVILTCEGRFVAIRCRFVITFSVTVQQLFYKLQNILHCVSGHNCFKKGTICLSVLLLIYFYQYLISDYDLSVTILPIFMIFALYLRMYIAAVFLLSPPQCCKFLLHC
jgi:hypothetical protein